MPYKCPFEFLSHSVLLFLPPTPTYRDIKFFPKERRSRELQLSMLYCNDQNIWHNNLSEEGYILLCRSVRFSPWLPAFFFGSMEKHSIMALGACSREWSPHGRQEVDGARIWYKFQRQPHSYKSVPPGPPQQY